MFCSIDAGNSNIVFGFYDEVKKSWIHEFRVKTSKKLTVLALEKAVHLFFLENDIKIDELSGVGISSVVPEVNQVLQQFCSEYLGKSCYLIAADSYPLLSVKTGRPNEIGSDLMCNAFAAFERMAGPCIVVDFGTALTFTVIGEDGQILGVNIAPGLKTAIKSLFSNTSKLPEVALQLPDSLLGKDTVHAIQAGVLYGYVGLVKEMLKGIQLELGYRCHIIATGGLSSILTSVQQEFDLVDRYLTVDGIRLITLANQIKKGIR
ncbi:type III pantothenate kinase [Mongoliitalea daihaiensis]|uniref:type III pantothenate kinase n=1 Tax=Mongoliitalea daihaiensis TaxID=2782006 RepID=UPI001F32BEEF|nr:type III pantothenate kinase [Mongoliitalea daihaiensis]UJP66117.1 type III pantothenate kinase [Mongoliitalea daihaiensis]